MIGSFAKKVTEIVTAAPGARVPDDGEIEIFGEFKKLNGSIDQNTGSALVFFAVKLRISVFPINILSNGIENRSFAAEIS
jgi:hypothetical protein